MSLNLEDEKARKQLWTLLEDADVFFQAFRLRALERKGFGLNEMLAMAARRGKGIVYVDLNCYGPDGYYAERPGFQQIADAASGCSYVCGKALGYEDGVGVLPPLPVADMLSGAVGVVDVLIALRDRAKFGGSYHATVALTAINTLQLEEEVGLYPPETVAKIQSKYEFAKFSPDLHVEELLLIVAEAWSRKSDLLQRNNYKVEFEESPWGHKHTILAPVVKYENELVNPCWKTGPAPYCELEHCAWST